VPIPKRSADPATDITTGSMEKSLKALDNNPPQ